jgi:hypothetical protein
VGEFGGEEKDLVWGSRLLDYLARKGLGWMGWSWSDWPYLTENDRRTPTAFGMLVKNALWRHAGLSPQTLTISDVQVLYITSDRATVNWKSNLPSDSKVRYGLSVAYTDSAYAPVLLTSHTIKLTGLRPSTTYHFQAVSRDVLGNVAASADSTFTTAGGH